MLCNLILSFTQFVFFYDLLSLCRKFRLTLETFVIISAYLIGLLTPQTFMAYLQLPSSNQTIKLTPLWM